MLVAQSSGGGYVEASRHLDGGDFGCPDCRGEVVLKRGRVVVPHFAHRPGADCESAGESIRHLLAKQILAEGFRSCGYEVLIEARYPEARRRVDVAVHVPNATGLSDFAVEVQDSVIDAREMARRSRDDWYSRRALTRWVWTGQRAAPMLSTRSGGVARVSADVLQSAGGSQPVYCLDVEARQLWAVRLESVVRSGRGVYPNRALKTIREVHREPIGFKLFGEVNVYDDLPRRTMPQPARPSRAAQDEIEDEEVQRRDLRDLCAALRDRGDLDGEEVLVPTVVSAAEALGWDPIKIYNGKVVRLITLCGLHLRREMRGNRLVPFYLAEDLRAVLQRTT